jgi:hypothetical protein
MSDNHQGKESDELLEQIRFDRNKGISKLKVGLYFADVIFKN